MARDDEYKKPFDNVVRSVFLSSFPDTTIRELDEIMEGTNFQAREILADVPCFPANSSHITFIGYNPSCEVLELRFKNNPNGFRYREVPQELWDDFVSTESFGSYFHKHIKEEFDFIELKAPMKKVTTNEL